MKNMAQRDSTQTLAAAVDCGNWVVVRDLLCDEDVDVADVERCLVLHKLASKPDISFSLVEDIVDEMLSRDVNLNMSDENGDTAVIAAARCENWKFVWLLMSRQGALPDNDNAISFLRIMSRSEYTNKNCGLSVNILVSLRDSLKQTIPESHHRAIHDILIHVAAKVNCWWLVRDLITADTANTLDEEGLGLVHRLAKGGMNHHISLLHKVLENGGDINLKNVDGETATHVALKNNNWKMVETLLQSGARADIFNNDNHTVYHTLPLYLRSISEIWNNADAIFSLLQKNCSNIDERERGGDTALQLAVKERNSLIAEKLMTMGARADVLDENCRTVLHTMATHKHEYSSSLLKQAIECGAELETKDSEGNTALHLAARHGNWDYVKDLIAHGAVVTEPDSDGCTVYDRIFMDKNSYICLNTPSLERFPIDVQMHLAVKLSRWNVLDDLVKKGANVNHADRLGFTVLQKLAQMESMKGVDNVFGFLVNRGANVAVQTPDGDNLLQLAAKHKNWLVVERMLKQQFSPLEPDSEEFTVLDRLAEYRYRGRNLPDLFRLLYKKTAVMSSHTTNGNTLLQLAAKHGNIPMVEYLVQEGAVANINQVDSEGLSVIHRTVQYESKYTKYNIVSVVNLQLSKGANPRLRSSVGDTALHLAARHNNWNIVECLVEHGCNLNEPDSEGFYVLHRLAQTTWLSHQLREAHKEVCEALFMVFVTKGADVSVCTSAGDTVIQLAAKHSNWNIVERLVELECDVNELDSEGRNVLHRLAQTAQRRQILYNSSKAPENTLFCSLLNKDADVSVRTSAGDSVIQLAAKHGNWNIVERLVKLECDVNELDSEGFNILHRFAQTTQQTQVSDNSFFCSLLNKGADVSVQSRTGDTALHLAAKCNKWNVVLFLVHQGCDISQPDSEGFYILHRIAQDILGYCKYSLDTHYIIFLDKGACPFVRNRNGDTVLHVAAKHRKWLMVKHLVEREANINEPDSEGFHILHRLVQDPNEKILELLVAKGVNLNCKCLNIGTALHMAAKERKWSFAKRLVEFGADVNERDLEGLSILHIIAAKKLGYCYDCIPLIHLLITKGADVTARSPSDDSVFHFAARYDNWEIFNQILAHRKDGTDYQRLTTCNRLNINGNGIEHVEEPDSEGFTILQRLAMNSDRGERNISLLQYLLDNGAKCDTLCPSGDSAMHLAVRHGNWYIIEELLWDKIKEQLVFIASRKERFTSRAQVSQFIEKRAGSHNSKTDRKQSARAPFNINAKDLCGNTVLHLSAKAINWDRVHTLLTCGADATLTDDENHTVLYWMVAKEWKTTTNNHHRSRVLEILRKGATCTMEIDEFGDTLIQIAARNKNLEVVDMLLNHLDDVNMRDSDGLTILHRVVQCTSPVSLNIVKTLIKRKADIEIPGTHGDTALHLASQWGNWDIVRKLLKNGARAGNTDSQGMSVLHRLLNKSSRKPATYSLLSVAFGSSPKNSEEKKLLLVKLMINNGVDINTKDQNGLTAVQLALIEKEWEVVQFLLVSGADVDQNRPSKVLSFLHELAMDTSVDDETARSVTQQLLSRDLCLNEREPQGDTPLNLAAICGNWKMVCVFLEHGADASLPDSEGCFVCQRLVMDISHPKHYEVNLSSLLLLLTRNGFQVNQIGPDGKRCVKLSLKHKKWELLWWLVESGVSYSFTLQEKKTILQHVYLFTSENWDPDKVRTFILRVTDKDDSSFRELTECKNEALKMTFSNCNWVVAKILVECGADTGLTFGFKSLLHLLILKYRQQDRVTWLSFLDALLARGVDINSRDENGRTILFQALRCPVVEFPLKALNSLLHELLDRGASLLVADNEGKSLLRFVQDLEKRQALQSVKSLIELGVSTHQPALTDNSNTHSHTKSHQAPARSPTQRAFEKKYVRVFEMLVASGASSNRELFHLNTRYQAELSSRDKTTAERQMLDILNHAASQPRSLKSLCRLTVSHALVCCSRRTDQVKSLPLPAPLQDYIQFCDVFSTEEETEETENAHFQGTQFDITDYPYMYSSPSDDEYDYEEYNYLPFDYEYYSDVLEDWFQALYDLLTE